jgi:hypothetical protein
MDGADQQWACKEDKEPCQQCAASQGVRQGEEEKEAEPIEVEFKQQRIAQQRLGLQEIERQGREAGEVEDLVELIEV